ncbi:MAG: histidine kinase [Chloroflexi bacterium]|nr:histidine kinase [Chloroflexota bacterium]
MNIQSKATTTVLIAEDELPIADVLAAVVEDAGFRAVAARNGREALEIARTQRPALVIADVMMPYLTGVELVEALRADAVAHGEAVIPVILMTAASFARARAAGADAVLRKPFNLADIDALLQRFLGKEITLEEGAEIADH